MSLFARVVLLPLLLALAVVMGLGSYFETSDDGSLAWLFSGVSALKPVASVPLYLHGYGHLLAGAYAAAPTGPWLGLLLAGLLAAASVLWFAVLERLLRPVLQPGWLLLALSVFFGVAWLEHWLWFSHVRVALLLAAGGVLFAAQRPGRRSALLLSLVALLAAWLIRPGVAALGAVAAVPAAVLLAGSWRRAAPLLLSTALLLAVDFGMAAARQTPAEAQVQARDARLARILDYEQLRPFPRTTADSLGTAAINLWLLGDSALVDPALQKPIYRFDAADFGKHVLPAKLALRAQLLLRDYFPLLLALLVTALAVRRMAPRAFWLVQLGYLIGMAGLAGVLKLPPRLALPLLDCWLITNLLFGLQAIALRVAAAQAASIDTATGNRQDSVVSGTEAAPRGSIALVMLGLLVLGLYAAKTYHRYQVLRQEQGQHENALAAIRSLPPGVRVLAGTNDFLKSLSPFRVYSLGSGPVLQLTGWPAHDASQLQLRYALTGTTDQAECLRRLARQPRTGAAAPVLWVLTPETASWLSRRSRRDGAALFLVPQQPLTSSGSEPNAWLYHAAVPPQRL